jgi:hypothetical protein
VGFFCWIFSSVEPLLSCGSTAKLAFVGGFVVAGLTAGWAIVKAILAKANIHLALAKSAVPFALALVFRHVALHAEVLGFGSGHKTTVAPHSTGGKCRK